MSTQKTTEQSTQKTKEVKFLGVLKGIVAFLVVTMSLFHVFFQASSKDYLTHKKTFGTILDNRDDKNIEIIKEHVLDLKKKYPENNTLVSLGEKLISDYKLNNKNSSEKVKEYNNIKRKITSGFSFRGRSSFHFWIFIFGLVSALFYFSCKSLFDEVSKGSTFRHHLVSLSGIIVACFWLIHLLFFTQNDFNKNVYFLTILGLAVLFSVFTYFLVKYYSYKDQIIYNLLGLVGRIKNKHYKRIATKAMYSEKNESSVISIDTTKENINEFDKDVIETLKKM